MPPFLTLISKVNDIYYSSEHLFYAHLAQEINVRDSSSSKTTTTTTTVKMNAL